MTVLAAMITQAVAAAARTGCSGARRESIASMALRSLAVIPVGTGVDGTPTTWQ